MMPDGKPDLMAQIFELEGFAAKQGDTPELRAEINRLRALARSLPS